MRYGSAISRKKSETATILKANAHGVAAPTVDLQVSTDGGASWRAIAAGLAVDRFGNGSYTWTADAETAGNTALIRALAHAGAVTVQDDSEAFLIANNGNLYYVNDGSLAELDAWVAGCMARYGTGPARG